MDLVLHAFYFAGEFADEHNQTLVDVGLADFPAGLAKKIFYVVPRLKHDIHDLKANHDQHSSHFSIFLDTICKNYRDSNQQCANEPLTIMASQNSELPKSGAIEMKELFAAAL